MFKRILLPAGFIAIAQLNQTIAMDPPVPAPQTPKTQEERNKEKEIFEMWATRQAKAGSSVGGMTQLPPEVASKIGESGQEIRYKSFTCPTVEEIKTIIKKNNIPLGTNTLIDFKWPGLEITIDGLNMGLLGIIPENFDQIKLESASFLYKNENKSLDHIQCGYINRDIINHNIAFYLMLDPKENNVDTLENMSSLSQNRENTSSSEGYTQYTIDSPEAENTIFKLSRKEVK